MASLDKLPEDVVLVIALQLTRTDIMALRLTSLSLSQFLAPLALSHLSISIYLHNYDKFHQQLQAYARRTTHATDHVRSIEIKHLAHRKPAGYRKLEKFESRESKPGEEDLERRDEELRKVLREALGEMRGLKRLSYLAHAEDPAWAFEVISNRLAANPIQEFELDFSTGTWYDVDSVTPDLDSRIVFDSVHGLERLTITNTVRLGPLNSAMVHKRISKIIETSPGLEELTIMSGCASTRDNMPALHDFFPAQATATSAGVPLKLKSLTLHTLHIDLDDITAPHFRFLERISVRYNVIGYGTRVTLHTVWARLRKEGVRLTRIEINIIEVEKEFLKYLEYCQDTLVEIVLVKGISLMWNDPFEAVELATYFWNEVLPNLAKLKVLYIHTTKSGDGWCLTEKIWETVVGCRSLKKVTLTVVEEYGRRLAGDLESKPLPGLEVEFLYATFIPMIA